MPNDKLFLHFLNALLLAENIDFYQHYITVPKMLNHREYEIIQ